MGTPTGIGFESQLGIGVEVTPGTPVVVTQKIPYISESLKAQNDHIQDNSLCGPATRPRSQQGTLVAEGGFEFHLRYTLQQLLLQHFFGTFLVDTPVIGTNTYSMDPSITGDALTVAIEKTVAVWEHTGFKVSEMTISGSPGDGITIAVDGFFINTDYASVINTSVVLDGLTVPGDFTIFQDLRLRIGDQVDALDSSDELAISEFEISINRNLEPTEVDSRNRLEAVENGFRETTFTFTVPRYCEQKYIDFHRNHTPLQAEIVLTDGVNTKTFLLPNLLVMEFDAEVGGPEFIEHPITLTAHPDLAGGNSFMTLQDTKAELELQEN